MLASLSPARRRLVVGAAVVAAVVVLAVAVTAALGGGRTVTPVAQDRLGPVLLLPGYGGAASGLDPLARALRGEGRTVEVIAPPGDGRGDLREHATLVEQAAQDAVDGGAPSVDVVGYSAGGVVARYMVAELGGGDLVRRVVTLSSPHHGTDLAAGAAGLGAASCPEACRQLAPGSELLTDLNRGDETPPGPQWVALWTTDDQTVVPPTSGRLEGAVSFAVQDVCPGVSVGHGDVPSEPTVITIVLDELGTARPATPTPEVCR